MAKCWSLVQIAIYLIACAISAALSGCGSIQSVAVAYDLSVAAGQPHIPPACVGQLLTSVNSDSLVQAVVLEDSASRACLNSATYPASQVTEEGRWIVGTDISSGITTRYRLIEKASACLYVIEVHQNYGGPFTNAQVLVLETGRWLVEPKSNRMLLTAVQRFASDKSTDAVDLAKRLAAARICGT